MRLLDSAAAPGSTLEGGAKPGAGDDRYAFDEAAGWAVVIDGATDVGEIRLYPHAESDAAWFAQLLADMCLAHPARSGEGAPAYFDRLLPLVGRKARQEARFDLATAPRSSWPTAAATWVRVADGKVEAATLGDTLALLSTPDGRVEALGEPAKPAEEEVRARQAMGLSAPERMDWLRKVRAIHNTPAGYWVVGVESEASRHVLHQRAAAPAGSRLLLTTDGFYRLVSPYGVYTEAELMAAAIGRGLGPLLSELRALEASPARTAGVSRFKTSDDAAALLFQL